MQGTILCTKRLLIVCLLASGTASQASMNPQVMSQDGLTQIAAQIAIRNESQPVKIQTATRPKPTKLALPKTRRQQIHLLAHAEVDDDEYDDSEVTDFQVGYRRPELVDDDEISDYIADRLANARKLALAKHREVWA